VNYCFQDLRENTCSLQPALKNMHPAFKAFFNVFFTMSLLV